MSTSSSPPGALDSSKTVSTETVSTQTVSTQTVSTERPSDDDAWRAVLARDRSFDGRFVTGVLTTGIYCRPSCAARHPKRENVRFFADGAAARSAGLRPCKRCRPDGVARDRAAVAATVARIEAADEPPRLAELAAAADYSPHHLQRIFRRELGVTPAAYARALRARRAEQALADEARVTDAVYAAGFSAPSRFYEDSGRRLGMTPSAWRAGGAGQTIRWATAPTSLGQILVAATAIGICRLAFDEDEDALRRRFPKARLEPGGDDLQRLVARAVESVEHPERSHDLPLDVRGTAFQEAVWRELTKVPPGETVSYAALAARAGSPRATRAVGSACGKNAVAVLIPCHRVTRADGDVGGYAYGRERKRALLEREARAHDAPEDSEGRA
ncbi:MAG: bifunctional DNA-binding transcriptional regulator/O6-methylguanine-DNA methyltransferase Ada [Acidobacteriota bacterium]